MHRFSDDWPSLRWEGALAETLYGPTGRMMLADWLELQRARVGDADFARLFSDHIELPGIAPLDYAHRHIRTQAGALLGGIRFYAQDITRPFVEVIAHSFDSLDALATTVAAEWQSFAPHHMRTRHRPGETLPKGSHIDTSIFLARYRDMRAPRPEVTLTPFPAPEPAIAMVAARFAAMEQETPELRKGVIPADDETLRALWDSGDLFAIHVEGKGITGLIAAAPGAIDWIAGDEVIEEIVRLDHAGFGYAAAAQSALAARHPTRDRLLIGTIDGGNIASRKTALKAGRWQALDYVFTPL
ncbi:hypothetical protein ACMA5I_00445 [Paracoccaceae bacterium GXU_MW_L88]